MLQTWLTGKNTWRNCTRSFRISFQSSLNWRAQYNCNCTSQMHTMARRFSLICSHLHFSSLARNRFESSTILVPMINIAASNNYCIWAKHKKNKSFHHGWDQATDDMILSETAEKHKIQLLVKWLKGLLLSTSRCCCGQSKVMAPNSILTAIDNAWLTSLHWLPLY